MTFDDAIRQLCLAISVTRLPRRVPRELRGAREPSRLVAWMRARLGSRPAAIPLARVVSGGRRFPVIAQFPDRHAEDLEIARATMLRAVKRDISARWIRSAMPDPYPGYRSEVVSTIPYAGALDRRRPVSIPVAGPGTPMRR